MRGENFRYFGHDCTKKEASAQGRKNNMPTPPAATHASISSTSEKTDQVFHFLTKALCAYGENPRLSAVHCRRLAQAFCGRGVQDGLNNHLQALVRGLKADDDLCKLAEAEGGEHVRRLVRLPVRELAPKTKKEQRERNELAALEKMQYSIDFRTDVIDKFDDLDAMKRDMQKGRIMKVEPEFKQV
jgi:hypothetical protein